MDEKQKARKDRVDTLYALAESYRSEYVNEKSRTETYSRGDAMGIADDIEFAAEGVAGQIKALYAALPNLGNKDQPFVDFAEGVLERVTEAMEDTDAAAYLDAAAVYYLFENHDIDIQEERDNRRSRIDAQIEAMKYEAGLSGKESK